VRPIHDSRSPSGSYPKRGPDDEDQKEPESSPKGRQLIQSCQGRCHRAPNGESLSGFRRAAAADCAVHSCADFIAASLSHCRIPRGTCRRPSVGCLNRSPPGALHMQFAPAAQVSCCQPSQHPTWWRLASRHSERENARVAPTIKIDHPLFNTSDEGLRIQRLLRHLGSGAELREFPGSASEKVALVKTANQRGLIAWHKVSDRYELTPAGWCELAPRPRFGARSMILGTTAGATLGALALAGGG
jgi:hypothetical protein